MSVHSTRLGAAGSLVGGPITLYTVPAGKRAILKSLVLQNNSAAANRFIITVAVSGGPTVSWGVTLGASASATESLNYATWIVMHVGDVLKVQGLTSTSGEAYASGTELDL